MRACQKFPPKRPLARGGFFLLGGGEGRKERRKEGAWQTEKNPPPFSPFLGLKSQGTDEDDDDDSTAE